MPQGPARGMDISGEKRAMQTARSILITIEKYLSNIIMMSCVKNQSPVMCGDCSIILAEMYN